MSYGDVVASLVFGLFASAIGTCCLYCYSKAKGDFVWIWLVLTILYLPGGLFVCVRTVQLWYSPATAVVQVKTPGLPVLGLDKDGQPRAVIF